MGPSYSINSQPEKRKPGPMLHIPRNNQTPSTNTSNGDRQYPDPSATQRTLTNREAKMREPEPLPQNTKQNQSPTTHPVQRGPQYQNHDTLDAHWTTFMGPSYCPIREAEIRKTKRVFHPSSTSAQIMDIDMDDKPKKPEP